jgi:hypothetical protein
MSLYSIASRLGVTVFQAECAELIPERVCFGKVLNPTAIPEALRVKWEELEQCANDQIIPRAEQILEEIDAMDLSILGLPYVLQDVQVMQGDKLSFIPVKRA